MSVSCSRGNILWSTLLTNYMYERKIFGEFKKSNFDYDY